MRLKPGVLLAHLTPQMVLAAVVVNQVYHERGLLCTITSGSDGTHSANSLHYSGNALDFRTRDVIHSDRAILAAEIKARLGENYDVVLESDHLHVEHDPK